MKDLISYALDKSYNNGAMDFCFGRTLNFLSLSGNIYFCSSFNMESLFKSIFNNESRILMTYYQSLDDDIEKLLGRFLTIFSNYPDKRIGDFFKISSNQKTFKNVIIGWNFDLFKISEFEGDLSGNSFKLYIFSFF